ncbi:hypothetical protein [Oryza sativa Japonica Group]|uniref:Uncharacterized protein n=1 Tax=Oryza sativa subsp. japonica TaxID=39947 RepID=Q657P5_ORYSJ|nr:hypothetical protein [Oryza sativa Japonica Group]
MRGSGGLVAAPSRLESLAVCGRRRQPSGGREGGCSDRMRGGGALPPVDEFDASSRCIEPFFFGSRVVSKVPVFKMILVPVYSSVPPS